jgi:hypothetical protein
MRGCFKIRQAPWPLQIVEETPALRPVKIQRPQKMIVITARIFLQVFLVVVFGQPKFAGGDDFSDDRFFPSA